MRSLRLVNTSEAIHVDSFAEARVVAKRFNCMAQKPRMDASPGFHRPCDICRACRDIDKGWNLDVLELDCSNARNWPHSETLDRLEECMRFRPGIGKFRVLILVHPEALSELDRARFDSLRTIAHEAFRFVIVKNHEE